MNENHSRTVNNHFLACFLDDCASLDVRAEVMHEEPHPQYAWAPWCACAAACACGGQNGSGSQLKVKAFGWWKTFGTLRQESACSSAQVGNRKRRLFEVLVSHTPPVGTIAVFAGSHWSISLSVLYHCFLWNRFWNRSSSRHITQREKQLGLKCRSQTPTIYQCYETVWLSTDPSALQLTFRNPICSRQRCELSCSALCSRWPLSGRRTASTVGRVRAAACRGEALNFDHGWVKKRPPTMPVATWLAWRRYAHELAQ